MTLSQRAYKLIEILGHPHKEIVTDIELCDITINSIEIVDQIIYVNIWNDEYEIKYLFNELSYDDRQRVVMFLEDILRN